MGLIACFLTIPNIKTRLSVFSFAIYLPLTSLNPFQAGSCFLNSFCMIDLLSPKIQLFLSSVRAHFPEILRKLSTSLPFHSIIWIHWIYPFFNNYLCLLVQATNICHWTTISYLVMTSTPVPFILFSNLAPRVTF